LFSKGSRVITSPDHIDKDAWDESRLVSFLRRRDEEAFGILIRRYQKKVFGIAYGITLDKEESLDIVQEVFLKVYEKIHTFRQESTLSTWLHRITVNLCLNWKRRWKRRFRWHHEPVEGDNARKEAELARNGQHPDTLYEKKELRQVFWQKLKELPEGARAVLVLREVEGLSYAEIAEALNIRKGTVSSRLFYARKRLKECLKEHVGEAGDS
jgi:RNA polymerase sigma-70 factor (ECF subfamily)